MRSTSRLASDRGEAPDTGQHSAAPHLHSRRHCTHCTSIGVHHEVKEIKHGTIRTRVDGLDAWTGPDGPGTDLDRPDGLDGLDGLDDPG